MIEKTRRETKRGLGEALQVRKEVMGRLRSDPNGGMRDIWETFPLAPPPLPFASIRESKLGFPLAHGLL